MYYHFQFLLSDLSQESTIRSIIKLRNTEISDVPPENRHKFLELKNSYYLRSIKEAIARTKEERDQQMFEYFEKRYEEMNREMQQKEGGNE